MSEKPEKERARALADAQSAGLINVWPMSSVSVDVSSYEHRLHSNLSYPVQLRGSVKTVSGMLIRAQLPNARIGELCSIEPAGKHPVLAQVVGFDDEDIFLTAFDSVESIGPQTPVVTRGESLMVPVGNELLGRVVDSCGVPLDNLGPLSTRTLYPIRRHAPKALDRRRITEALPVGIRAVDCLLTIGEGQRIGVFSTAGVGKSSLLGMLARNSSSDVNVVALVGERGREVQEFLEDNLGAHGLEKSVVVVSTSDDTPLRRITAAYTATAIAEYFRDQGMRVMLLMDSVTRFARALREIALSLGEPPARQGFPPSVFATLPELFERAGKTDLGSITAIYTVLLSSEQIEDPLGEEIRAILDGHFLLSARLAKLQHFPAIDILASNSRVMDKVTSVEHRKVAERIRRLWSVYEENSDLILLGAYKSGSDAFVDEAIQKRSALTNFLIQGQNEISSLEETLEMASSLLYTHST